MGGRTFQGNVLGKFQIKYSQNVITKTFLECLHSLYSLDILLVFFCALPYVTALDYLFINAFSQLLCCCFFYLDCFLRTVALLFPTRQVNAQSPVVSAITNASLCPFSSHRSTTDQPRSDSTTQLGPTRPNHSSPPAPGRHPATPHIPVTTESLFVYITTCN